MDGRALHILHIEDSPYDGELIARVLSRGRIDAVMSRVMTADAFRAELSSGAYDIVLADFHLPAFDGMAALDIAREVAPETPFVFVSGAIGEERAIAAMQRGATDYVLKDRISRLPAAVRRAIAERDAQRQLRLSQERFLLAAQATLDVIWDWNIKDNIVWLNDSVQAEWGHDVSSTKLSVDWWKERMHPADAQRVYDSLMEAVASDATHWQNEYRFRRADGTYGFVHDRAAILRDEWGRAVRVIGAAQNITARVEAQRELEREQRISSLGRVAAVIAHEFNNVLMSIQPFAEIVRRRAGDDASLLKASSHITAAVDRGRRITGDILRAANPGTPSLETLDFAAWMRGVAAELRTVLPASIAVTADIPSTAVHVRCDPCQMHQVLTNLAANARDAMKGEGELCITLGVEGADAVVTVADDGSGIPERVLPRVFDPLFTTKSTGTGLGLAVAKQIVDRNGGRIDVDSIEGRGTVFSITLPLAEEEAPAAKEERVAREAPSAIRRLLIIDDDRGVTLGMSALLELEGFVVHAVERAAEVAEAVQQFQPHAVILDLTLPDASGTDVYRSLAATTPGLPVVFASGNAEPPEIRKWSSRSPVSFLRKPFDVDDLLQRLRDVEIAADSNTLRS